MTKRIKDYLNSLNNQSGLNFTVYQESGIYSLFLHDRKLGYNMSEKECAKAIASLDNYFVITKNKMLEVGSVEILLNGKRLLLDLENLKDSELAMRDEKGNFELQGEHHFTHENALRAAEKIGKRLFTKEEFETLRKCENYWDDKNSGRIFKIPTPSGDFTEVFFPAAGCRAYGSGSIVNPVTRGYCWSASPYGSAGVGASYLSFSSGLVYVYSYSSRATGRSVRCIREI